MATPAQVAGTTLLGPKRRQKMSTFPPIDKGGPGCLGVGVSAQLLLLRSSLIQLLFPPSVL